MGCWHCFLLLRWRSRENDTVLFVEKSYFQCFSTVICIKFVPKRKCSGPRRNILDKEGDLWIDSLLLLYADTVKSNIKLNNGEADKKKREFSLVETQVCPCLGPFLLSLPYPATCGFQFLSHAHTEASEENPSFLQEAAGLSVLKCFCFCCSSFGENKGRRKEWQIA